MLFDRYIRGVHARGIKHVVTREWKGDPGALPPWKFVFRFVIFLPLMNTKICLTNFIRSIYGSHCSSFRE